MAQVRIVLSDEDYTGAVTLDIDWQPSFPADTQELTPAQWCALQILGYADREVFGPNEDGETIGSRVEDAGSQAIE